MATSAPSGTEVSEYDDTTARRRIGPWTEQGVPDLSEFEPNTNFFVRAAAGSGKTTALVARMVGLVRAGVSVEDIAAITFTRKAAGEMSKRFYQELRDARKALPEGTDQWARVATALQDAQRTFIGTVHAFCARLLRERPLAADLPPGFTAGLEDRERRELRERAWQRYLQQVRGAQPERIEALTELGIEPEDLEAYFQRLCEYPELDPYVHAPTEMPELDDAVESARQRMKAWQEQRPDAGIDGRDEVQKALDKGAKMLAYRDLDTPAEKAAFLGLFTDVSDQESANVTLKYWGERGSASYEWARSLRDERLPKLVRDVVDPALYRWNAYVHKEVVRFVQPAVEVFAALRREEGSLTFHDLLVQTRDLLRDHPRIRATIQGHFPHLLVDEFQDTDPLQAEILFYLASGDPTEKEWTQCRPRPGSLFIVGDDKQSIYRFRRADMEVFASVGQLLEEKGGESVTLTKNFRSVPALCDWCDKAFGAIFDDPDLADVQAPYTPFDPQRSEGGPTTGLRRIGVEKVPRNRGADIAEQDARRIARFVRAALDGALDERFYEAEGDGAVFPGGADASDFLILTRTKSRLSVYAEALAERAVPYTVTGSEDLGDASELKAIVDVLTCALRPDDAVACVAYLKGPLVGASDDDLYRYQAAGGRFDRMYEAIPSSVRNDLDCDRRTLFGGAFERLRRARHLLRTERPSVAVERIVDEMGLLAGAAHPADPSEGSLRAGHVLRTVTYVQDLTARGTSWAEVVEELQRIVDGEEEVDGMTLETGSEDAVQIMNVHQAKGLEAPVVFLADPYSTGGDQPVTRHLRRATGEIVAPVVQGSGYYQQVTHPPLGWEGGTNGGEDGFRALERRHEMAEERRLLYVAATRAQELLVVSTYPEKPDDGYWAPLYPHLEEAEASELERPRSEDTEISPEAPAPRLQAKEDERRRRLERLARPSFGVESVTDAKPRGPAEVFHPETDGYGEAFGEGVHALLEQCVRMRFGDPAPPRAVVHTVLEENGAEGAGGQVDRAEEMIERFLESALWRALRDADRTYTEYPLARTSTEEKVPVVERGVVDLAFRKNEHWILVDYKSDRVEGNVEELLRDDHPYVRQIRRYAENWEQVLGEPVGQAGLWFADTGTYVSVVPSS